MPVGIQGLNADMASSSVQMFLDTLLDHRLIPPSNHGVEKAIAATIRQVSLAEAKAQPVISVIGQGNVNSHRLTRYLSCIGGVIDQ
jgi:hypothetical protein